MKLKLFIVILIILLFSCTISSKDNDKLEKPIESYSSSEKIFSTNELEDLIQTLYQVRWFEKTSNIVPPIANIYLEAYVIHYTDKDLSTKEFFIDENFPSKYKYRIKTNPKGNISHFEKWVYDDQDGSYSRIVEEIDIHNRQILFQSFNSQGFLNSDLSFQFEEISEDSSRSLLIRDLPGEMGIRFNNDKSLTLFTSNAGSSSGKYGAPVGTKNWGTATIGAENTILSSYLLGNPDFGIKRFIFNEYILTKILDIEEGAVIREQRSEILGNNGMNKTFKNNEYIPEESSNFWVNIDRNNIILEYIGFPKERKPVSRIIQYIE